ncbi:MAG TPA: hypothetical protein PKN47_01615 [Nitrospira sp.]|nr:hypothetical protein [Nitrospira sp.]
MKLFENKWQGAAVMLAVLCALVAILAAPGYFAAPVQGATDNPAQGATGIYMMTFHFDSQLTATVADKAQWKAPWPARLIAMKCSGRAFGGSGGPTYTWTLQEAAGTLATCAPTTAATEVEGTISDALVADEASLTLDYAATGTSPTQDDATVILIFKRL